MSEQTVHQSAPRSTTGRPWFRVLVLAVIALAAGLVVWLVLRERDSSTTSGARAVSAQQISALAAGVRHPVYWLGPQAGFRYELRRQAAGTIAVRYLPSGAKIGARTP